MKREQILAAVNAALADKGKRKFTQSVELALNFKGIDFNKQDNRINLEVALPKGKGRDVKVAVFADGQLALDAKNAGAELVVSGSEIPKLATDKPRLKSLMKYEFLAQPQLMAVIGKSLGQVLGTKDKLPKPVMGAALPALIERAKRTVKLKTKGKYLPTLHCLVGTENMGADDIADNIEAVFEAVKGKVQEQSIKSAYVKLTMGKPQKIM
ncbi:MAG: 50S ribosomal protein L1 [Candidatus Micrarchaeota archaeon]